MSTPDDNDFGAEGADAPVGGSHTLRKSPGEASDRHYVCPHPVKCSADGGCYGCDEPVTSRMHPSVRKPTAATVDPLTAAKDWLANLTPDERELIEKCTCDLARPYWHSFHREGCLLAR